MSRLRRRLAWLQRHGPMFDLVGRPVPPMPDNWDVPDEFGPCLPDHVLDRIVDGDGDQWRGLIKVANELDLAIVQAKREGRGDAAARDRADLDAVLEKMWSDHRMEFRARWGEGEPFGSPMYVHELLVESEMDVLVAHAAALGTTVEAIISQAVRNAFSPVLRRVVGPADG